VCTAIVETEKGTFTGIEDANPDNVNRKIVPHLIRRAETRAKARAMRDAVNIGVVAMEELGGEESESPILACL
jgi:predicted amidohydrolase YtcJ